MYVDVALPIPIEQVFTYGVPEACITQEDTHGSFIGRRVKVPFGKKLRYGVIVREYHNDTPQFDIKKILQISSLIDKDPILGPEDIARAQWVSDFYFASLGESLACVSPTMKAKKPRSLAQGPSRHEARMTASDDQLAIIQDLMTKEKGWFYLFGITGSGKTEVFLRCAEHHIQQGKQVLYLVPEIALSYQLQHMLLPRFQSRYAVLHSRLTESERLSEWQRIARGDVDIVLGTRSAVFAPLTRLGLIIIDEEQDSSYKSESSPRYHARQVAMHRVKTESAVLLMGSATPSVESWYAMQQGVFARYDLRERIGDSRLPVIRSVDMHFEEKIFSEELLEHLKDTVERKKQSILFINRRGFANVLTCKFCRTTLLCQQCSIPLVYHKKKGIMLCHYCNYSCGVPRYCHSCNSVNMFYRGFGAQLIEEELHRYFPSTQIARLDRDVSAVRGEVQSILERFRNEEISILFGTQMIAKGFDFPEVELVAIISADIGLHVPDFRATERIFSQIVQVSGRSGRRARQGKVFVQTHTPSHHAIQHAIAHEYSSFYKHELSLRKTLGFPPYTRFIRVVFTASSNQKLQQAVSDIAAALPAPSDIEQLGPAMCPIERIAGKYRMHIIFSSPKFGNLHAHIRDILGILRSNHSIRVEVDVDPLHTS